MNLRERFARAHEFLNKDKAEKKVEKTGSQSEQSDSKQGFGVDHFDPKYREEKAFEQYRKKNLAENVRGVRKDMNAPENHRALIPDREPLPAEYEAIRDKEVVELEQLGEELKALKQKIEEKNKVIDALEHHVVIFDHPSSFEDLRNSLRDLKGAGVSTLRVGQNEYNIDQIVELTALIQKKAEQYKDRPESEIDTMLANFHVTRSKISPHSAKGMRECLIELVHRENLQQKARVLPRR